MPEVVPAMPTIGPEVYQQILRVASRLASTSDLHQVLSEIIDALRDLLDAERASVFQYDPDAHQFFAGSAHGLPADLRLPADAGLIGQAAKALSVINIPDAYDDPRFNRAVDAETGFRTRCLLTIPLLDFDHRLVGVAQVLNKRDAPFDARDEAIAEHLAAQAAVALKRAALIEAERDKDRMAAALQVARKIQQSALPAELPDIRGYDLAAAAGPAEETGGDAFDLLAAADGSLIMLLADATGHGVGPALSVTQASAMIRMGALLDAPLDRMVAAVNRRLQADLPIGRFITAFVGRLDPAAHTIDYCAAGQAPTLIARADGRIDVLGANAMPLGIDADEAPDLVEPIRLDPGDALVLLSDGYYETLDPDGRPIGQDPIADVLAAARGAPGRELLAAIERTVDAFAQGGPRTDDRTAVIIRRLP